MKKKKQQILIFFFRESRTVSIVVRYFLSKRVIIVSFLDLSGVQTAATTVTGVAAAALPCPINRYCRVTTINNNNTNYINIIILI